jgi:hypothetical protein
MDRVKSQYPPLQIKVLPLQCPDLTDAQAQAHCNHNHHLNVVRKLCERSLILLDREHNFLQILPLSAAVSTSALKSLRSTRKESGGIVQHLLKFLLRGVFAVERNRQFAFLGGVSRGVFVPEVCSVRWVNCIYFKV